MNKKKFIIYSMILVIVIAIIVLTIYLNKQSNQDISGKSIEVGQVFNHDEIEENAIEIAKKEDKNIVLDLTSDLDYAIDLTDNQARANNAEYIVLATITSIDGAINYNEAVNEYTAIFTYGNMKISKVLQGNLEIGNVPFIRLGGEIRFSEYEKGLKDSQKEKMELVSTLTDEEKENSYVSYSPNGDIELEVGKTYLMYLKYNTDYNKYMCSFMQYGTREVNTSTYNSKARTTTDNDDILVKDNESGEWKSLSSVLD